MALGMMTGMWMRIDGAAKTSKIYTESFSLFGTFRGSKLLQGIILEARVTLRRSCGLG